MTAIIEKTVFLKAPPDRVWRFLTQPDELEKWFHRSDVVLEEGLDYCLFGDDGDRLCWGHVIEAKEPSLLRYTFTHNYLQQHETTVTWRLEPIEGGTRLSLVHDGFEGGPVSAFEMLCAHDDGWDEHFAKLRQVVVG